MSCFARAAGGRSHALRCAAEPRPRIGNPGAAHAAGGRDAVLEVAEVEIYGLAELHAICMNRHDGEGMNDDSMSIVGQQARGERMRKDDVPRTDLADQ